MITVRISGPARDRPHDLASKLASSLIVSGKIVRQFRDDPPAVVLGAHGKHVNVTIITIEEQNHE